MTYRRLFLWLFTGSTLLLAGVWWFSMMNRTSFAWKPLPRGTTFSGNLYSATIGLIFVSDDPRFTVRHTDFRSVPARELHAPLFAHYRPLGNFRWQREIHLSPSVQVYLVDFPIWLPWLLFVSGAFVVCRWLERRAGAVPEKKLAEARSVDRMNEPPH